MVFVKNLINNANVFFEKNKKQIDAVQKLKKDQIYALDLTEKETNQLEELFKQSNLRKDFIENISAIKLLTSQIKSIQKQHVLLVGEKIFKVREILRQMGGEKTTFSSWINLVFSTKSSAYNALAYYEFFINLPNDQAKQLFQAIPHKAAYVLAARKGDVDRKVTVLKQISGKNNQDAIRIVNTHFPSTKPTNIGFVKDDEYRNKEISKKLLEVVNEIHSGLVLTDYNINLLKYVFELI